MVYRNALASGEPYGYLPSGQEEELEDENVIEAEFWEVPPVEEVEEPVRPSTPFRSEEPLPRSSRGVEDVRREREAALAGEELARSSVEAALAKQKLETLKLEEKKRKMRGERYKFVMGEVGGRAKSLQKLGTLGGVPATQRKGGITDLYFGRAKGSLYVPETPTLRGEAPIKSLARPQLERLRRATAPATGTSMAISRMTTPSGRGAEPLDFSFLREMAMPRGLSRVEHAAFAEIRANHDQDTLDHVVSELVKLGFARRDTETALRQLEQKGMVEKGKKLLGEPLVYSVR